ncbi:MAG: putative L-galactonate oxidoreductase [Candidatus Latescibacteria bacterium ADurb.Bin168]|nr:MAG: putative L-galactonate oxidoreductase [Candidatus Latescibacteria bacterium ADurb.Bin168]
MEAKVSSREVVFVRPRKVEIRESEIPDPGKGEVLVRTLYSGISHGTEMTWYRGTSPRSRKDVRNGLFEDGDGTHSGYPCVHGYEEVGEVVELGEGVNNLSVGDRITCVSGHREYAIVNAEGPYVRTLPPEMDPVHGVFLALGGVALDALLSAPLRLGESAVVFGQGVIGLLLVALCRRAGAYPVIAVDPLESRREMARAFGAHHAFSPGSDLAHRVRGLCRGKGADVAFEVSGTYPALHEAFRVTANPYGTVVAGGFYQGEARGLFLGEEFHHSSHGMGGATRMVALHERIESPASAWGLQRVLDTVWRLYVDGSLPVDKLVTHVYPASSSAEAFRLVDEHPEACLKVVLDMRT